MKVTKEELMGSFEKLKNRYMELEDIVSSFYKVLPEEECDSVKNMNILDDFTEKFESYIKEDSNNG